MKTVYTTLDLSKTERAIVSNLQDQKLNIAQISRLIGISRATIYPHIRKLVKKGILKTSTSGKRILYTSLNEAGLGESIITTILKSTKSINISNELIFYKGVKQIQNLWLKVSTQPKHSRVISFQTNSSLEHSLSKMSVAVAKKNHKNFIKNKIIVEQYAEEGMYELVKELLKRNEVFNTFPASDFTERTTSTILLPKGLFTEPVEIFILFNSILIIDWKLETGYEIQNPHLVTMYKQIFSLIRLHGKLIDNADVTNSVFLG